MASSSTPSRAQELSPLLPGGYTRGSLVVGTHSPQAAKGHGCYVIDGDGRELIDLNNDFTSLVHGNAHPAIVEVSRAAIEDGSAFGLPTHWEHEHAQILVDRIPGAEQVRYTCSGTEAVMTAVRIARAVTGRSGVVALRDAYHGYSDSVIGTAGPKSRRGVPVGLLDELILVDVNDIAALEAAVSERPEGLAAILVDAMPNRAGMIAVTPEFLQRVRELCDEHGILFIDDEVINLRQGLHGVAAERGVLPDIVVTGKIIGGGYPAGAVLSSREIMAQFDPERSDPLEQGGTFAANPLMLRAGAEALRLFDREAIARLNALGEQARSSLAEGVERLGWTVRGEGSLFRPIPPDDLTGPVTRRLFWAAHERGVSITPTAMCALSTPMDADVVGRAVEGLVDAIESVSKPV
ncbi:MAG: aminotransferase class III-fold pyridoxal phosphate-dependent enzyme [Actinobacteria bacterium]|nr:aminotransferase class III-fold pyridoxal phosphate-dependent enzyme [Actinomycetota bacterium]